jgi:hypothetical protein
MIEVIDSRTQKTFEHSDYYDQLIDRSPTYTDYDYRQRALANSGQGLSLNPGPALKTAVILYGMYKTIDSMSTDVSVVSAQTTPNCPVSFAYRENGRGQRATIEIGGKNLAFITDDKGIGHEKANPDLKKFIDPKTGLEYTRWIAVSSDGLTVKGVGKDIDNGSTTKEVTANCKQDHVETGIIHPKGQEVAQSKIPPNSMVRPKDSTSQIPLTPDAQTQALRKAFTMGTPTTGNPPTPVASPAIPSSNPPANNNPETTNQDWWKGVRDNAGLIAGATVAGILVVGAFFLFRRRSPNTPPPAPATNPRVAPATPAAVPVAERQVIRPIIEPTPATAPAQTEVRQPMPPQDRVRLYRPTDRPDTRPVIRRIGPNA